MALINLEIQTTQGPRIIKGRPVGQSFFAHRAIGVTSKKLRWTLTHRGSGHRVGPHLRTLRECRLKAVALERCEVDWMTLKGPKVVVESGTLRLFEAVDLGAIERAARWVPVREVTA